MYIYLSPGESLTAVMAGAITTTAPTYSLIWRDNYNGASTNSPVGRLTGVTPVTLVTAQPAVSWQCGVEAFRLHNTDSADITVTLAKVVAGTSYTLTKITLSAGDHLTVDERGILVNNLSGQAEAISTAG